MSVELKGFSTAFWQRMQTVGQGMKLETWLSIYKHEVRATHPLVVLKVTGASLE